MADELRRFPSLDSKRMVNSHHTRCRLSASASLTSTRSSLSRFPSPYSTRASTITPVTTATSPSLSTHDDEHTKSSDHHPPSIVSLLEPANVSLYEDVRLLHIDSFRILRVKPGSPGTPLNCELLATRLREQKNCYSALSYTWEGETANVPVCVNGRTFDMPRNLVDFICTLRSPHRAIRIWADAICIDHQSSAEKTHQVQLMGKIYSNAACTQSWLGHHLPILEEQMKLARKTKGLSDDNLASNSNVDPEHVLLTLLNHCYWTHTWVIQDILLAKQVWVHCGNEALRWDDLLAMARRLANSLRPLPLRQLQLFSDSNLMHLQNLRRSTKPRGLPELLMAYANYGCENVQDRIFGLIGLISERNDPLFAGEVLEAFSQNRRDIIDYSLPVKDLFRRLMDMYPLLPAQSFTLPLWSALELDDCHFESLDFCQRIEIQGFPCSMLMISRSHRRILTGAVSSMDLDDTTREELLCLSDPHNKAEARQSRVCLAIRIRTNDFEANGKYLASACLVEARGLTLNHMGYDNLCRAFETTCVYKQPQSVGTDVTWTIDVPLTALKALHAIVNPAAGQRLLHAVAGDILNTEELDYDLAEWAQATRSLAPPSSYETENASTPQDEHVPAEPVSQEFLPVNFPKAPVEHKLPPRTRRRYRILKRARLNGLYDWMVRPLYGDRLPAWE